MKHYEIFTGGKEVLRADADAAQCVALVHSVSERHAGGRRG
jgi:hypothetical protein